MKTIFKSMMLLAAAATAFTACNKEVDVQEATKAGERTTIRFSAVVNDAETKATLTTEDEKSFKAAWDTDDKMDLSVSGNGHVDDFSATWSGSFFEFDIPSDWTEEGTWAYEAYYPYKNNVPFSGNRVQNGSKYASQYDVMLNEYTTFASSKCGYDSDGNHIVLPMTRATSIIYFHLTSDLEETLASATLTVDGGDIAATTLSYDSEEGAFVPTEGVNTITLTFAEGTAPSAKDFCLWYNIMPVTATGLTLTVTTTTGKTATLTNSKGKTYAAGKLNKIVKSGLTWEEGEKYYVKVTSDEDIVAGDYLIVFETADKGTILTGVSDKKIGTITETPVAILEGNKIAQTGNEAYNVVVEEGNEGYTLKLGEGYLAYNLPAGTTKNNNLFLVEAATETGTEWILSADGIQNVYNDERYLQFNSDRFACYTHTQADVALYLLEGSGHTSGKPLAGLAYETKEYEITLGDEFTAPELTNPNSLAVTYASDNTEVATVDETTGAVTIVAAGTAKITASFAGNDDYKAGSAFYTITVNPVKDYIFYESFDQCKGKGGNDNSWSGSIASSTLSADNEDWTFEKENGADKCAKFGTSSVAGSATTPVLGITNETTATLTFKAGAWDGDATTLNITVEGGGQASVKSVTLANAAFTEYTVILGNGIGSNTKVKFAANQDSKNRFFLDEVKVFAGGEMPVVKTDPTLTFSSSSVEVTLGETVTAPTLTTDPAGLAVTYASSNTAVATVNAENGALTLVAAGTTTITATFAGNDLYNDASASYTLRVNSNVDNGKGTLEDPFNVAGAYEYINNSGSDNVYVKGIVSSIATDGEYAEKFGNATFFISDDGTADADQFEAYRVLFIGNHKWKEGNTQIKVGDEVILYGKVTIYKGTYETAANNAYVYSLNGITTMLATPVATIDTNDATKEISVSWAKVDHATSYEVSCGNLVYTAGENETSHSFTMTAFGDFDVKIIAKGEGYEASISDIKTATLSDPSVSFTEVAAQTFSFSGMGYENAAEVSTISGTNDCSIVFAKGTNNNAPKYYTSGTAVRAYGGNTITITANENYQVSTIKLTFGSSDGSNAITASTGEYKDGVWTGKINNGGSVVFTIGGTSGNRRISAIAINPAE